jgi:hypothetical protein
MGRAIMRGTAVFSFPWQTRAAMGVAQALPNALFDPLMRKLR